RFGTKRGTVELFELWPATLLIAAVIVGLLVGSFLNVVAYRVPLMMERAWREQCIELSGDEPSPPQPEAGDEALNLWWPPSSCRSCGHRIAPWHNIPVISYLLLRGRCASCGAEISRRYPIVEAFAALLS